jgi:hypothetical protein
MKKIYVLFQPYIIISVIIFASFGCKDEVEVQKLEIELVNPINNALGQAVELNFNWKTSLNENPIYEQLLYEFHLWEKDSDTLILNLMVYDNQTVVSSLKNSVTYYWKVTVEYNNQIYESENWEFTTEPFTIRESVTLTSQVEVNKFRNLNCKRIIGDVHIESSEEDPITDLSPLTSLETIEGSLYIFYCSGLITLAGFDNLNYANAIFIQSNPKLEVIKGFNNLNELAYSLHINDNKLLTKISAFENLSRIYYGSIELIGNTSLSVLDNFKNLKYLAGELKIYLNSNLQTISGFDILTSVGADLYIVENENLTSIPIFNSLDSIGGNLALLCNYNKITEIKSFNNLRYLGGYLHLIGENLVAIPEFNKLEYITSELSISYTGVSVVYGFGNLSYIGGGLNFSNNTNLKSINGLNKLDNVGESYSISGNEILMEINGLSNLISVNGTYNVTGNNTLSKIVGPNKLKSIGTDLIIMGNWELTAIEGFENLTYIGTDLMVFSNSKLLGFCGLKELIESGGLQGIYTVQDNLLNPTEDEILEMECNK